MSLKNFIMLNAKDYLEIGYDIHINVIMLIIAAAVSVASFWINYHKTYTVNIIKQLLRHGATSEETAMTLPQLHLDTHRGLKSALTKSNRLTDIISRVGYVKPTYEEYVALMKEKKNLSEKIDFSTAKFFIPEEKVEKATMIKEKENPTVMRTALLCVFIFAVCVCIMLLMPELLTFIAGMAED